MTRRLQAAALLLLTVVPTLLFAQGAVAPRMITPFAPGGGSSAITAGTTTITGGTNTRVIFNDSGVWGEDAGFTYVKATDKATLLGGLTIGSVTTAGRATSIFLDTIATGGTFWSLSGTMPATLSGITHGVTISIVPDNDAQVQSGLYILFSGANAGATSYALRLSNGTSTNGLLCLDDNGTCLVSVVDGGAATFSASITGPATDTLKFAGSGSASLSWFSGGLLVQTNTASQYALYNTLTRVSWARDAAVGWTSSATDASGTVDTVFGREAAATVQFGADVNGAAVVQTLKAHDGITGTDIAGANFTLAGGRGTGAGAGGNLIQQTSPSLATGTTAQTLQDRTVIVAKAKALTESAATQVVLINVASGSFGGGSLEYTVQASDATDHQARSGRIQWAVVNKAGTETCTVSGASEAADSSTIAASLGTLTYAITADTTAANGCYLSFNAVSSLTQTTLNIAYRITGNGVTTTFTPQ